MRSCHKLPKRVHDLSTFNLNAQLPRRLDLNTFNLRALNDAFDAENPLESSFDTVALTDYCVEKACGFDYRTYFDHEEEYARSLEEQDVWKVSDKRNKEKRDIWMESCRQLDENDLRSSNECRCDIVQCLVHHDTSCYYSQIEYSGEEDTYAFNHESDYCIDSSGPATINGYGPGSAFLMAQSREKSPGLDFYDFVNEKGEGTRLLEANGRTNNNYMRRIAECCGGHDNSLCDSGEEDSHALGPENTAYLSGSMSETDTEQYIDPPTPSMVGMVITAILTTTSWREFIGWKPKGASAAPSDAVATPYCCPPMRSRSSCSMWRS
jgi:hypothetical protein